METQCQTRQLIAGWSKHLASRLSTAEVNHCTCASTEMSKWRHGKQCLWTKRGWKYQHVGNAVFALWCVCLSTKVSILFFILFCMHWFSAPVAVRWIRTHSSTLPYFNHLWSHSALHKTTYPFLLANHLNCWEIIFFSYLNYCNRLFHSNYFLGPDSWWSAVSEFSKWS